MPNVTVFADMLTAFVIPQRIGVSREERTFEREAGKGGAVKMRGRSASVSSDSGDDMAFRL